MRPEGRTFYKSAGMDLPNVSVSKIKKNLKKVVMVGCSRIKEIEKIDKQIEYSLIP